MAKRSADEQLITIAKKPKVNHNAELCKILSDLGEIEKNKGDRIRWKAYRTAVEALSALDAAVTSGTAAMKLPGVGKKIAQKIDEILATGKLQKLETAKEDPVVMATALFTKVIGIGPVLAHKLVHELGCRSFEDLKAKNVPLNHQQTLGLRYFEDMKHKIPYAEIKEIEAIVAKNLRRVDKKAFLVICGSHRRGKPESGDIDVLVTQPSTHSETKATYAYLGSLVQRLKTVGLVIDDLAEGTTKYMGFCRLPKPGALARRIDIRFVPYDCFWTSVLYFTGSDLFNVQMRKQALKKGYTVNEYGAWKYDEKTDKKLGERISFESEKAIFALLGMSYTEPEDRSL